VGHLVNKSVFTALKQRQNLSLKLIACGLTDILLVGNIRPMEQGEFALQNKGFKSTDQNIALFPDRVPYTIWEAHRGELGLLWYIMVKFLVKPDCSMVRVVLFWRYADALLVVNLVSKLDKIMIFFSICEMEMIFENCLLDEIIRFF